MNDDEKRRRTRTRRSFERLGTSTPVCTICSETNPNCLEVHEPGGRKYSDLRVILCRNCHRKLSDDQRDHFPPIWTPPDPLERLSHALLGEADLLLRLAEKRRADARMLNELSRRDVILPDEEDDGGDA